MKIFFGNERGSVLMETVLVLPILLMLFGGLFVMGDILLGRLHLLTVDRGAAWAAGSRFLHGDTNFVSRSFAHVPKHTALVLDKAFVRSYDGGGSSDEDWFGSFFDDGNARRERKKSLASTEWLEVVSGHAWGRVEVPIWAAMVNTHSVVSGGGRGDWLSSQWRLLTKGGAGADASDYLDFGRTYVVRRVRDAALGDDYRRTREARELGWFSIPLDRWPDDGNRSFAASLVPKLPARPAFSRHETAMAFGD